MAVNRFVGMRHTNIVDREAGFVRISLGQKFIEWFFKRGVGVPALDAAFVFAAEVILAGDKPFEVSNRVMRLIERGSTDADAFTVIFLPQT